MLANIKICNFQLTINPPDMKTIILVLLCLPGFTGLKMQVPDLTGTWTMYEMSSNSDQGSQKMTEAQMKANGSLTDYFFLEEGKFRMNSNMTGSGNMETYDGTWKLDGNKLTITLTIGGRYVDVIWDFVYKDNIMNLARISPDGSIKIVNTFRKK
jgi:hypothetical protein